MGGIRKPEKCNEKGRCCRLKTLELVKRINLIPG